jgi:hypothetical protein
LPPDPESALDAESPLDGDSLLDALLDRPDDPSLRAQPVPLKWTAGAANAFFISPPQLGQVDGPWPWTECMTSTWWPHFVQT